MWTRIPLNHMPLSYGPLEEPEWTPYYDFRLPDDSHAQTDDPEMHEAWLMFKATLAASLNSSEQIFQFNNENLLLTSRISGDGVPTTEFKGTFYSARHYYQLIVKSLHRASVFDLPNFGAVLPKPSALPDTNGILNRVRKLFIARPIELQPPRFDEHNLEHVQLQFASLTQRIAEELISGRLLTRLTDDRHS